METVWAALPFYVRRCCRLAPLVAKEFRGKSMIFMVQGLSLVFQFKALILFCPVAFVPSKWDCYRKAPTGALSEVVLKLSFGKICPGGDNGVDRNTRVLGSTS